METEKTGSPSFSFPFELRSVWNLPKPYKTAARITGFPTNILVSGILDASDEPGPYEFPSNSIDFYEDVLPTLWSRMASVPLEVQILDMSADKITIENAPILGTASIDLLQLLHECSILKGRFKLTLSEAYIPVSGGETEDVSTALNPEIDFIIRSPHENRPAAPIGDFNDWNLLDITINGAFGLPETITKGLQNNNVTSTHQVEYVCRVVDTVIRGGQLVEAPVLRLREELAQLTAEFENWQKKKKPAAPKAKPPPPKPAPGKGNNPVDAAPIIPDEPELLPEEIAYNTRVEKINAEIDRMIKGGGDGLLDLTPEQQRYLNAENGERQILWNKNAAVVPQNGKGATARLYLGRELLHKLRTSLDSAGGCWVYFYPEPLAPLIDGTGKGAVKGGKDLPPLDKQTFLSFAAHAAGRAWLDLSKISKDPSITEIHARVPLSSFDPTINSEGKSSVKEDSAIPAPSSSPTVNATTEEERADVTLESTLSYVSLKLKFQRPIKQLEPTDFTEIPLGLKSISSPVPEQTKHAMLDNWKTVVEDGLEAIASEFSRLAASSQLVASHSSDVQSVFKEHLKESGVFGSLEESTKQAMIHLAREFVRKNPDSVPSGASGLVGDKRDIFYSHIFAFLQRELNFTINQRLRAETDRRESEIWSSSAAQATHNVVTAIDFRQDPQSGWFGQNSLSDSGLGVESFDSKCVRLALEFESEGELMLAADQLANRILVEPGRTNPQAYFHFARFCARNGKTLAAETILLSGIELVEKAESSDPHLLFMLAALYLSRDQYRAARHCLSVVLKHNPTEARAMLLLAFACFGQSGEELAERAKQKEERMRLLRHADGDSEDEADDEDELTPLKLEAEKWLALAKEAHLKVTAMKSFTPDQFTPDHSTHQTDLMNSARAPPIPPEKGGQQKKEISKEKGDKKALSAAPLSDPAIPMNLNSLVQPPESSIDESDILVLNVFDLLLGFGISSLVLALGEDRVIGEILMDCSRDSDRYKLQIGRALMCSQQWREARSWMEQSLLADKTGAYSGRESTCPEAIPLFAETLLRIIEEEKKIRLASGMADDLEDEDEDEELYGAYSSAAILGRYQGGKKLMPRHEFETLHETCMVYLEKSQKLTASNPDPLSLIRLGKTYLSQQLYAPGASAFIASLHRRQSSSAWAGLGFAQVYSGDAIEAVNSFVKATACNPGFATPWLGLCIASLKAAREAPTNPTTPRIINKGRVTDADQAIRVAFKLDSDRKAMIQGGGPMSLGRPTRPEISEFVPTSHVMSGNGQNNTTAGNVNDENHIPSCLDPDILLEISELYLDDASSSGILAESCARRAIESKDSAEAHFILGRALARQELYQRATLEMQVAIGTSYEDTKLLEKAAAAGLSFARVLGDHQLEEAVLTARQLAYAKMESRRQQQQIDQQKSGIEQGQHDFESLTPSRKLVAGGSTDSPMPWEYPN